MHRISTDIYILSETIQRARVIKNLIENDLEESTEVNVIQETDIGNNSIKENRAIFLVDLMSYKESSRNIIKRLKNTIPDCKVIALHIYNSSLLIEPLFESGVDGYIHSEPSRNELLKAINTVHNGDVYRPVFIKDC